MTVLVAQLYPTLCDPKDCTSVHGILQARILEWVFQWPLKWPFHFSFSLQWPLKWPFPSAGSLPNVEIKPRSPALQADSLLSEPPGKHHSKETST